MAFEDDQTIWRTVFCKDPSLFSATTYPYAGAAHTVVQSDPTKLLCTTTPSAITAQKVIQSDASLLKMTNTPDGITSQPIHLDSGIKGIWPPEGSTRVNASNVQSGVGNAIVYTVPANKALYIGSASMTASESADAASQCWMGVRNAVDAFQYWMEIIYLVKAGQMVLPMRYQPALELETGWDVFVKADHENIACRGTIHGWLEDA